MTQTVTVEHGTSTRLITGALSTDRAESSYGQPVLVIDGRAYGPGDEFSDYPGETTHMLICAVPDGVRRESDDYREAEELCERWNGRVREASRARYPNVPR